MQLECCKILVREVSCASAWDDVFLFAVRFVSDAITVSEEGVVQTRLPNRAPLNESLT